MEEKKELKDDSKLIREVERQYQLAEQNQSEAFTKLRELRQVYRAVPDAATYNIPTRAQYVIPEAFEKIEGMVPKIISVLFSVSPPIQSKWRVNREYSPEDQKLRILDHMFDWHYDSNQTQSLFWRVYGWVKDALIYGQSYIKVGWIHRTRTEDVKKSLFQAIIGNIIEQSRKETIVVEDDIDVQNPSIFSMYFSPDAVAPDIFRSASWVIEKSQKPRSKILAQRGKLYKNFDENGLFKTSDELEEGLATDVGNVVPEDEDSDPMVDIYERWEDERLVVTANHKILLRDEPNPFGLPGKPKKKPYVAALDYLILNELWQIGEVQILKDLQKEMTTLRRMRTDVNNLTINPMWIINRAADVNESELGLSRPGGFIHAMPQDGRLDNAVTQLKIGPTTGLSSEEYSLLKRNADEVTGFYDYSAGAPPERRETATTVQLLQVAGNARIDLKVRGFSHSFTSFNWMIFERWKQLLTKEFALRIPKPGATGFDYVKVTRDMLPEYDDVDLVAQGDPAMLLKDARKQEIAQMYEIVNNNPYVMPKTKLKAMMLVLKSKELEGVDSLIQELEQVVGMIPEQPSMMVNPAEEGGPSPQSPAPEMPQRPEGAPLMNETPQILPFPKRER